MKSEYLKRVAPVVLGLFLILGPPTTSFAYVGPGAGLSIIGSLLAFLAAIVVGIFGFLWFPIRRFLRKRKLAKERAAEEAANVSGKSANGPGAEVVKQGKSDA